MKIKQGDEVVEIEVGREYYFTHTRKGKFRAIVKDVVRDSDETLFTCLIDTSPSGAPRLARARGSSQTLTNIRPSLLTRIEPVEPYQPPPEQLGLAKADQKGFFKKLFLRN